MNVFNSIEDYQFWRSEQGKIAFVPTMGNLHEGHLSLVRKAQEHADVVVVSIFVNPLQFAAHEDLESYPRTLQQDTEKLETVTTTALFAPSVEDMYPEGNDNQTQIMVPALSKGLCGSSRPHFFQGVATVVCKLFNIIKPDYAVFGEKDFQQLLVVRKMVKDLRMPLEIIGAPIVREESGLAMSSRNGYLSQKAHKKAGRISATLAKCAEKLRSGEAVANVLKFGLNELTQVGFTVDYFELRDHRNLMPLTEYTGSSRLFVAAFIEGVRLIDNIKT